MWFTTYAGTRPEQTGQKADGSNDWQFIHLILHLINKKTL